jgi:hypothetical protein
MLSLIRRAARQSFILDKRKGPPMTSCVQTRRRGTGRIFTALAMVAAFSLQSGCATRPDGRTVTLIDDAQVLAMSDDGLNATEVRQLERAQRYAEMRVTGAAGGAVLGAFAGAFAFSDNAALGAAGGAAAGAALGYLAGAYVANLNEGAEDRRNDLNAQLAAARKAVDENEAAVRDNRSIVSAETRRIDDLNRKYRAGEITKDQYAEEIDALDKKLVIVDEALRAAESLAARGVTCTVADARFAKPLDTDLIGQLARHHGALITVEQGAQGGFGAQVLHHLAGEGLLDVGLRVRTMTLPDRFIDHASPAAMYADAGLTAEDIAATALRALGIETPAFGAARA